jgi:hypothetical protein
MEWRREFERCGRDGKSSGGKECVVCYCTADFGYDTVTGCYCSSAVAWEFIDAGAVAAACVSGGYWDGFCGSMFEGRGGYYVVFCCCGSCA